MAAQDGGADAVSLINTINSIMRVNYDTLTMYPTTDGMGTHGGYCGEAVKPIALNMVAEIARNSDTSDVPISGIGNEYLSDCLKLKHCSTGAPGICRVTGRWTVPGNATALRA